MKKIITFFIFIPFLCFAENSYKNVIAKLLVDDEVNMFLKGNDSLFTKAIKSFNASELIKENRSDNKEDINNQRIIRIKTVVSEIKKMSNEHVFWIAHGLNKYEIVYLYVNTNHPEIKQGENIDMICLETGQYIIYPVLKNCIPTEQYANKLKKVNIEYLTKTVIQCDNPIYFLDIFYNALLELYVNDIEIKQLIDYGDIKLITNEKINNKINYYIDDIINQYSEKKLKNIKLAIIPEP